MVCVRKLRKCENILFRCGKCNGQNRLLEREVAGWGGGHVEGISASRLKGGDRITSPRPQMRKPALPLRWAQQAARFTASRRIIIAPPWTPATLPIQS